MIDNYEIAKWVRSQAEQYQDPHAFEIAAQYFELVGMELAAQRCRDRAKLYLELADTMKGAR